MTAETPKEFESGFFPIFSPAFIKDVSVDLAFTVARRSIVTTGFKP